MTNFCLACGLPLDKEFRKYNRRFEGKEGSHRRYCNETCSKAHDTAQRKRNKKKYGIAGTAYF